ncbi:MAG: hypothetical protein KA258_07010, partial [Deltaproteobacteria bacterium]|nr:hypothetical protein [Deltaproteobacteria bacterium]
EAHGKTLGWTPARIKEVAERTDSLVASFEGKARAAATYQAAIASHDQLEERLLGELRGDIREIKASKQCSDGIKADLQIVASSSDASARSDAHPTFTAEAQAGFVRLRFRKLGFDSVNVYARQSGESEWRFLARDTNSPYDDHRELSKPGTPEVREYRLIGVVKDQESGTPSDATSVTFSG